MLALDAPDDEPGDTLVRLYLSKHHVGPWNEAGLS